MTALRMKMKRRIVVPNEVMALMEGGAICHLRPGQTAPGRIVHTWPFLSVAGSPGAFMMFLLDAKRRGATKDALRQHFDAVGLETWVTDGRAALGLDPSPSSN